MFRDVRRNQYRFPRWAFVVQK